MSFMRIAATAAFCLFLAPSGWAQVTDTSVCEILANPASFDGKIVRVKGTVIAGFDDFVVLGAGCNQSVNAIWLSYPEGTKAKSGPAAFIQAQLARNNSASAAPISRAPVTLDKNMDFKEFDSLLSSPAKTNGMCPGCIRNKVNATLVGRLDGAKDAGVVWQSGRFVSAGGFGNMNHYTARLVLQSVADIAPQEIDYSKDAAQGGSASASAPSPAPPTADQYKRAVAAFGAPGEDNGVYMGFGVANEVPRSDSAKGTHDSPDGLLFNCTIDADRLKGDAQALAIAHLGSHIADVRSGRPDTANESAFASEYRAWQVTTLGAISNRLKLLMLPGNYQVWNSGWAEPDRERMINQAISKELLDWVNLGNPESK